jgi:hypothetical protein
MMTSFSIWSRYRDLRDPLTAEDLLLVTDLSGPVSSMKGKKFNGNDEYDNIFNNSKYVKKLTKVEINLKS